MANSKTSVPPKDDGVRKRDDWDRYNQNRWLRLRQEKAFDQRPSSFGENRGSWNVR